MSNQEKNRLILDTDNLAMNRSLSYVTSLNNHENIVNEYVGFKKASDKVYCPTHGRCWTYMVPLCIPQRCFKTFQELYTNSRCCGKTGSDTSNYFKVEPRRHSITIILPSCNRLYNYKSNESITLWNHIFLEGAPLEVVENLTHLGSIYVNVGDVKKDVKNRSAKAFSVFRQLQTVWGSKVISLKAKLRLYNSIVLLTALYVREA